MAAHMIDMDVVPADSHSNRSGSPDVKPLLDRHRPKLWKPKRVLVTPAALEWEHGHAMLTRAEALDCEIVRLKANRLAGLAGDDPRRAYVDAKNTLAIVVAPPTKLRLQPIPPSADWRLDLAEGCPAHCQYCYLAGSLAGPPVTRVYANLPEILSAAERHIDRGAVTSRSAGRRHEGTTFEASCYTDPLGIEHLTGSLGEAIGFFAQLDAAVQLRFTTKFDAVGPLLKLDHNKNTRMRVSVNAPSLVRLEGGAAGLLARLQAARRMAEAGYRIGLTIAPIMPVQGWQEEYRSLLNLASETLGSVPGADLTIELITHRFTAGSKEVLTSWYPGSSLEMDEDTRAQKRTKFGSLKYVYQPEVMEQMRGFFMAELPIRLPEAQVLYWT
ncbi:radical SAM protein [Microvirga terrae]|uniref:Radical SAM protein n=2 Tax=Methylobacteriaceae TaxID=119045 RepID=A0ABY5RUK3_9HYPH|nr:MULTISPECIES: radical SAM protein [Microvirga]UVF20693.1 radical SAM protein [Microvirga terrae]